MTEKSYDDDTMRWDTIAEKAAELSTRLERTLKETSTALQMDHEPAEYFSDTVTVGELRLIAIVLDLWVSRYQGEREEERASDNGADAQEVRS